MRAGAKSITLATRGEILRRGNLPGGMLDGIVCLDDRLRVRVELGRADRVELVI